MHRVNAAVMPVMITSGWGIDDGMVIRGVPVLDGIACLFHGLATGPRRERLLPIRLWL